jgi:large repetitive protein
MTTGIRFTHILTVLTVVVLTLTLANAQTVIQPSGVTTTGGNLSGRPIGTTIDGSGLPINGGAILTETHSVATSGQYWISASGNPSGVQFDFDLGGTFDVDSVHLWQYTVASGAKVRGLKTVDITFSTNGGVSYGGLIDDFGPFAIGASVADSAETLPFTSVSGVTHIRFTDSANQGDGTYTAFNEIRFGGPVPVDTTPPTVTTLSPTNTATDVVASTDLVITFDEDVAKGTNGNIVIQQTAGGTFATIAVTSSYVTVSSSNVTINPASDLASGTDYHVEIDAGAITDIAAASNEFAGISGSGTWAFTTAAADVTAPTFTTLSPTNNATGVSAGTDLVITFDEDVQKGSSGNIVIQKVGGGTFETIAVTSPNVTVSGSNVTINPSSNLDGGSNYYVEIDSGAIEDLSANDFTGISGSSIWSFQVKVGALVATDLNTGGIDIGFGGAWAGSGNLNIIGAADLAYANYGITQTGTTERIYSSNTAHTDRQDSRALASAMSGDIWFSILVNVPSGGAFAGLALFTAVPSPTYSHAGADVRVLMSDSQLIVDLDGAALPAGTGSYAAGTTHLLLGQINVVAGNDTISVWVDPDLSSVGEPGDLPAATYTSTTVDFSDSIGALGVPGAIGGAATEVYMDAIWLSDRSTAFVDVTGVTGPDVTAPILATLNPTHEATGVSAGANLVITLDEDVQKGGSGNIVIQQIAGGTFATIPVGSANVTVSGADVTIDPASDLAGLTGYYVEIDSGAIEDLSSNAFTGFSGSNTWNFVTGNADLTAPIIAALSPTNGATGVSVSTDLVISFDEDVKKGSSGNIVIQQRAGGTFETIAVTSPNVTVSGTNVTISASSDFTKGAGYYVEIDSGAIEDLVGNGFTGISGSGTWSFEVAPGTFAATDVNTGGADAGFSGNWYNGSNNAFPTDTNDLTYGDYAIIQSGSTERVYASNSGGDRQDVRDLAGAMSGNIWFSVLVYVPAGGNFATLSFNHGSPSYDSTMSDVRIWMTASQVQVGFAGAGATAGTGSFASDTTHLILGQMNVVSGNDTISVWVDPDLSAVSGPGDLPAANYTSSAVDFTDSIIRIGAGGNKGSAAEVHVDAIRLSDTTNAFNEVTGLGIVETTAPTIAALSPANTAPDVAVETDLVITFSEAVKKGGSGNIVIQQTAGGTFETIPVSSPSVTLVGGGVVRINPASNFAGTTAYHVDIDAGAFTDFAATPNAFAGFSGSGTWGFTTEVVDITAPSIYALSPTNGNADVSLISDLVITFDENVQKGASGNIVIQQTAGGTFETIAVTSPNVTVSGSNVTINPAGILAEGAGYYVEIDSGAIIDLAPSPNAFAGISGSSTWSFTVSSGTLVETDLNTGGIDTGFSGGWNGSSAVNIITTNDLVYSDYFSTQEGTTERIYQSSATADRQDSRELAIAKSGEIWFSILVNVPTGGAYAGISFHSSTPSQPHFHSEAAARVLLTPTQLLVDLDGGDPPLATGTETGSFAADTTHLLLGQMNLGAGNDTLNVWVDPVMTGIKEPGALPAPNFTSTTVDFADLITIVGVPGAKGTATEVYMDAIRVSDTATAFDEVAGPLPFTTVFMLR